VTLRHEKRLQPLSKGERTAARIRAAALDLFSLHGFDSVSTADVAAAARVSQPAVLYHFQDKGGLWRSAMLSLAPLMNAPEPLAGIENAERSALERLRLLIGHYIRLSAENPALARVLMREGMAGGPRLKWLIANVFGESHKLQMKLIRQAIADGELRPYRPEQIIIMMHAAASTFRVLAPFSKAAFKDISDNPKTRDAQKDLFIDVLFRGLQP
jgi:TetR/AcrR family transcriptional regulator